MKLAVIWKSLIATAIILAAGSISAGPVIYSNVFNIEGESAINAAFVTYASLLDMLNDENRTGIFEPDGSVLFGPNIVGTGSDGTTFWNLFNIEGESAVNASFVTYASLLDLLNDENRTGNFEADGSVLFGQNIVGTGSDGTTYWNLFNIESESTVNASFVTYASLLDMLNDENRTGNFEADGSVLFGPNIVGTGSDGTTYWNLFNIESESTVNASFVTYASLLDMLNDENRTGIFEPDGSVLFGPNIVGTGAFFTPDIPQPVPQPPANTLLLLGIGALMLARRSGLSTHSAGAALASTSRHTSTMTSLVRQYQRPY